MSHFLRRFWSTAATHANNLAIIHYQGKGKSQSITYAELDKLSDRYAEYFGAGRTKQFEIVTGYLRKSIEHVAIAIGALKAGAAFCSLNPKAKASSIAFLAGVCKHLLVCIDNPALLELAGDWSSQLPRIPFRIVPGESSSPLFEKLLDNFKKGADVGPLLLDNVADDDYKQSAPLNQDCALILLTSGSTGTPKAVMISHQDLYNRTATEIEDFELTSSDRLLSVLPLSFDVGANQCYSCLSVGATLVILNSWLPHDVAEVVEQFSITGISGVPYLWSLALQSTDNSLWKRLSKIRYITISGGDLPVQHLRHLHEQLPGICILKTYGQTETFRSGILYPLDFEQKLHTVGKPVRGTKVVIIDERRQIRDPGEPGEIVHIGDGTMMGYLGDAAGTKQKLRKLTVEGQTKKAVFTGDTGVFDKDGYLVVIGRRDKMLKVSGYRIYPEEIRRQLISYNGVHDAVVFGMKDSQGNTDIYSEVILDVDSAISGEENFKRLLSKNLPSYMVPKHIFVVESFPRAANGKVRLGEIERKYHVDA